jgi:hypothetical protein
MRTITLVLMLPWLAAGCAAAPLEQAPPASAAPPAPAAVATLAPIAPVAPVAPARPEGCPPPDTRVGAQEVEAGAALVFTTPEDIADLRRDVANVMLPGAPAGEPPRFDNIHHGVRVVFETEKESDVGELRRRVHEHTRQLAARCDLLIGLPEEVSAKAERPPIERHHDASAKGDLKSKPSVTKKTEKAEKATHSPKHPPKSKPKTPSKSNTKPAAPPRPNQYPAPAKKPRLPTLPGAPPSPLHPPSKD